MARAWGCTIFCGCIICCGGIIFCCRGRKVRCVQLRRIPGGSPAESDSDARVGPHHNMCGRLQSCMMDGYDGTHLAPACYLWRHEVCCTRWATGDIRRLCGPTSPWWLDWVCIGCVQVGEAAADTRRLRGPAWMQTFSAWMQTHANTRVCLYPCRKCKPFFFMDANLFFSREHVRVFVCVHLCHPFSSREYTRQASGGAQGGRRRPCLYYILCNALYI